MIEYIEINGTNHPFVLNIYSIGEFQKDTGIDGLDFFNDLTTKFYLIEPLLWHSLRAGYAAKKEKMSFTREDMPSFLNDDNIYLKLSEVLSKSVPKSEGIEDIDKKK